MVSAHELHIGGTPHIYGLEYIYIYIYLAPCKSSLFCKHNLIGVLRIAAGHK